MLFRSSQYRDFCHADVCVRGYMLELCGQSASPFFAFVSKRPRASNLGWNVGCVNQSYDNNMAFAWPIVRVHPWVGEGHHLRSS